MKFEVQHCLSFESHREGDISHCHVLRFEWIQSWYLYFEVVRSLGWLCTASECTSTEAFFLLQKEVYIF